MSARINISSPKRNTGVLGDIMSSGFEKLGNDGQLQDHWLRRLVAFIIDSVILFLAVLVIWGIASLFFIAASLISNLSFALFNIFAVPFFTGIASVLYFTLLEHVYGQTFGKSVMKLRVSDLQNRRPTLGQAFIRNISKIYWILLLIDLLIGLAMTGDPHQKLSDRFIGTTASSTVTEPLFIKSSSTKEAPKNCVNCGKPIPAESKYCPYCGKEQS